MHGERGCENRLNTSKGKGWKKTKKEIFIGVVIDNQLTTPSTHTEVAKMQSYANHVQHVRIT